MLYNISLLLIYFIQNNLHLFIPTLALYPSFPHWVPLVCFLYLRTCFCSAIYIQLFYFLDSTYQSIITCLSLTYFTKHNILQVQPHCYKWRCFILFYGWIIKINTDIISFWTSQDQKDCTNSLSIHLLNGFIQFIHSSGCFHVLAIVNSVTMTTGVRVSFWIIVFFRYMPRTGIAGSHDNSMFSFWGTSILFSVLAVSIYIPANSVGGFPFNPCPHQHIPFVDCEVTAILTSVWWSTVVTLISLIISDVEHSFMCWLPICISSLEKRLFRSSAHFLTGLFGLWYWVGWGIYVFIINPLLVIIYRYFLTYGRMSFCFVNRLFCKSF